MLCEYSVRLASTGKDGNKPEPQDEAFIGGSPAASYSIEVNI